MSLDLPNKSNIESTDTIEAWDRSGSDPQKVETPLSELERSIEVFERVDTISNLKSFEPTTEGVVLAKGYNSKDDGGGGFFWWDAGANAANANGGTIIASTVAGYTDGDANEGVWRRIWDREAIDVRWFGAIPDGTTDYKTEITNAVSAAKSHGGGTVVCSAPGTYISSPQIELYANIEFLIKEGAKLKAPSGSYNSKGLLYIDGLKEGIRIAGGGHLQGQKKTDPTGNLFGIKVFGAIDLTIENLKITDFPGSTTSGDNAGDGVYIGASGDTESEDVRIHDLNIQNCTRTGIAITSLLQGTVSNCVIEGITGNFTGAGIDVEANQGTSVKGLSIVGITAKDCHDGILLTAASSGVHKSISVEGCVCENNRNNGFRSTVNADVIVSVVCRNNANSGVETFSAKNHTIGCVCQNNGDHGVLFDSFSRRNKVQAHCKGNGKHGVYVKGGDALYNDFECFCVGNGTGSNNTYDNMRVESNLQMIKLVSHADINANDVRHHLSITGKFTDVDIKTVGAASTSKIDGWTTKGIAINGLARESGNAEKPQVGYPQGTIVEFKDTGDGSGNGVYLLLQDGSTWAQISSTISF